jgi:hypothetical protein
LVPRSAMSQTLSIGVKLRVIARDSENNIPRENAHDVAQRLNQFFFFGPVLELADFESSLPISFPIERAASIILPATAFSIEASQHIGAELTPNSASEAINRKLQSLLACVH